MSCDDGNFVGASYACVLYDVPRNNVKSEAVSGRQLVSAPELLDGF